MILSHGHFVEWSALALCETILALDASLAALLVSILLVAPESDSRMIEFGHFSA